MRVLLVHSYYRSNSPSGEAQVFESELDLLQRKGIEVETFTVHSDRMINQFGPTAPLVAGALASWNPLVLRVFRHRVQAFRPDLVHVHNVFPWISPSVFYALPKNTASVLTLHNYRIFCPNAIPARKGQICTECLDNRSVMPALRHGCYRQSRLATLPLALNISFHRWLGTWNNKVDALITLTDFQRKLLIKSGLPSAKVHVKPNFISGTPRVNPWAKRGDYTLFVGRLSEEKGLTTLIDAWRIGGAQAPRLLIVGDGPLRNQLASSLLGLPIHLLGPRDHQETQQLIANARLLLVPSECFEGLALVIVEAFSLGTPVACSNLGPLPSIVKQGESGLHFEPHSPADLFAKVKSAWASPGLLEKLGQGARAAFDLHYNETANFAHLMAIYHQALEVARRA